MLPKLLPILEPASLSRQKAVASMKPTGMMVTSPILSWSGELAASPFGWGGGAGSGGVYLGLGAGAAEPAPPWARWKPSGPGLGEAYALGHRPLRLSFPASSSALPGRRATPRSVSAADRAESSNAGFPPKWRRRRERVAGRQPTPCSKRRPAYKGLPKLLSFVSSLLRSFCLSGDYCNEPM